MFLSPPQSLYYLADHIFSLSFFNIAFITFGLPFATLFIPSPYAFVICAPNNPIETLFLT
jgi:hypothetical protein